MDSSGSGALGSTNSASRDAQQLLGLMVLQVLNEQVHKTCFTRCFSNNKFGDELSRSDQLCLAKCMDRMYEAHAIVSRASAEMAQNLQQNGGSF